MISVPQPDALTRLGRFFALALAAAFLLWLAYRVRVVLVMLAAAIFLGHALEPIVQAFSRGRPQRRPIGIAAAFLMLFVGLGGAAVVIVGPALRQSTALAAALVTYAQSLQPQNVASASARFAAGLRPELRAALENAAGQYAAWLSQAAVVVARQSVTWASSLPTFVLYAGVVLAMTWLLLADRGYFRSQAFRVVPTTWQDDASDLVQQIDDALAAYVRGQLAIAGIVGLLLTIGMLLLEVHYALPLGLFAAVTQLVPLVGGAIGMAAAVAVAAFQGLWVAVEVLLLFSVIFFYSGNVLGPRVMGRAVAIHPLLIIIVTFAGTLLGGVVGLLLAVPVTAILRVIIRHVYSKYAAAWRLGAEKPPGSA
ncbi:MAG TPA: AI-2E family transporter [bacterium]|nr:AI-2E family transporter [bacterium]